MELKMRRYSASFMVLPNGASTKEIPNLCAPSRRQAPLVRLKLGAPPPIRIAERLRTSTALWLVKPSGLSNDCGRLSGAFANWRPDAAAKGPLHQRRWNTGRWAAAQAAI